MTKRKRTKKKLWSVTRIHHPRYRGYMLRVLELKPGGDLYVCEMVDGKQVMNMLRDKHDRPVTRLDLGTTAKAQEQAARAVACEIIEALVEDGDDEPVETGAALTLGSLATLYQQNGLHGVTASYRRDQVAKLSRITAFLGADRLVVSLCRSDVDAFTAARLLKVSRNTIHGDVGALKIALNWATEHRRADGRTLLDKSPLTKVRVQKDKPARPWCTPERYEELRAVADQLPPGFACLLSVAWATGHRISAVLALKWQDVSFATSKARPNGAIRWYAKVQTNKKQRDAVVPMNSTAREALERYRALRPGIVGAWIFTSPRNPAKPLGKWVAKRWLRQAEQLAGLEHEPQCGWHQFRRGWATARKHLPLVDIAEAGGWSDTATLAQCYTHADPETTLRVVNGA